MRLLLRRWNRGQQPMSKRATTPPASTLPVSPCINVCRLSLGGAFCIGCRRTPAEIQAWPSLTDEQKRALVADLEQR